MKANMKIETPGKQRAGKEYISEIYGVKAILQPL